MRKIEIERHDGLPYLRVRSALLSDALALELKSEVVVLVGQGERVVVLDMRECVCCDPAALNSLLTMNRLCQNARGLLVLCGVSGAFERLIADARLNKVLTFAYDSRQVQRLVAPFER